MPSAAHVVFIPAVILLGMVIGYVMGARAVRNEMAQRKAKRKE